MFPIREPALSFRDIADYWSREINPPASKKELLALLEKAWWLGEIHGNECRLDFLRRISRSMRDKSDAAIVFVDESDEGPSPVQHLADGSALVDVRPRVRLPSGDAATWTEDSCTETFYTLAQTEWIESYPERTFGIYYIKLSYNEFTRWLAQKGFRMPNFWQPTVPLEKVKRQPAGGFEHDPVDDADEDTEALPTRDDSSVAHLNIEPLPTELPLGRKARAARRLIEALWGGRPIMLSVQEITDTLNRQLKKDSRERVSAATVERALGRKS